MSKQIETHIVENLSDEEKQAALSFIEYLKKCRLSFHRDTGAYWKDKIYFWIMQNETCICFIAIKDPDDPQHSWTIWSDDSTAYENAHFSEEIKQIGWAHVNHCSHCGSCNGGKEKIIFGKAFRQVCGCTFRIDNASFHFSMP